ncbi:MAG: proline iminopeptidase-family hydrolase [Rubrivivax sp.]|nr:proline iminopeptidase-family hydrolase [Rubrivivax sp.]
MTERMITLANGHRIWARTVGDGPGLPLLLLHGGPGAGHDYLEPLQALGSARRVVFYDQLGCGKSDRPARPALWTIERFADEVDEVRAAMDLEQCHILGQSWGGWLAIEYALRQPAGVASFVFASTSASIPQFRDECSRLIGQMPEPHRTALVHHGARGEFEHPDYQAAMSEFYQRHVCRLPEWPACLMRTVENLNGNPVYETMNGPNEFTVIGNLRYWDRTTELPRIGRPVLITCGRHDELGPACASTLHKAIPDARTVIFEHSAHCAHIEEQEGYLATVGHFLAEVEKGHG